MTAAKAYLKQNRPKRLEQGHPWVYPGEIARIEGEPQSGDVIHVYNHAGYFLAQGFYNPLSQLVIRIFAYSDREVDEQLFYEKIEQAWQRRRFYLKPATP